MIQINLLPWREQRREEQKKQFIRLVIMVVTSVFFILLIINYSIAKWTRNQSFRNQMLQQEIITYEHQLKEIAVLKIRREKLVSKMSFIHKLQSMRMRMVCLLDELSKVIPSDMYLTRMEGINHKITLSGYTTSNNCIAQVMKNMESSDWIHQPVLREIKRLEDKKWAADNQFKLTFILKLNVSNG